MADVRATVFLLSDMMRHRDFLSVSVHKKPARLVRAEIEVSVVRAHDVGVLLTPFRLSGDLDDDVGVLVDLMRGARDEIRVSGGRAKRPRRSDQPFSCECEMSRVSGQNAAGADVHCKGGSAFQIFEMVGEGVVAELQENVCTGHFEWGEMGRRERTFIAVETGLPFDEQGHPDREVYHAALPQKKPTWYTKHATWERVIPRSLAPSECSSAGFNFTVSFSVPKLIYFTKQLFCKTI